MLITFYGFTQKMIKAVIIFISLFIIVSLGLIKTSDSWIPKVYRLPSHAEASGKQRFPPNLKISIDFKKSQNFQNVYIFTNEEGALIHSHQVPAASIILGSRSSNLFLAPDDRWTSLVKLPNYNFSFPNLLYSDVVSWVQNYFLSSASLPKTLLLCDVAFLKPEEPNKNTFRSILQYFLGLFRIWDSPMSSHPLYEWLFFNFSRYSFAGQFLSEIPFLAIPQTTLVKLTAETEQKWFVEYLANLKRIKEMLDKKSIKFSLVLLPGPSAYPIQKKVNIFLRQQLPKEKISFVDVESCFFKNELAESFFLPLGYISKEGQKILATCFDKLYSEAIF